MSANGMRTIIWAGGEHQFCLSKVGSILDLEAKCGAGIAVVMTRLGSGAWGLNDVRETIRLGLIGGGLAPDAAMQLVRNHVDPPDNALAPSVLIAYAILEAVMVGVPDDPVGKKPDDEAGEGADTGKDELGKAGPAEAAQTGSTMQTDASDAPKSSQ